MERKERKKPGTKGPKKKTAQPKTTQRATVKKAVAKKKATAKKTAAPKRAAPKRTAAPQAAAKKVAPKRTAAPQAASKKVAPKRTAAPQAAAKKTKRAIPTQEMTSRERLEAFSFGLFVGQLQDFFKWCWENIDKEKTRDLVIGLYRTIFFPFESMPVHEPLPIWRQRQVLGFLKSLTSPNAAALEKIIKQWARETDRDLDLLGGGG